VQRNIAGFGGDPTRVTIDGASAGAMLVSAMVGSPEGKGLFKRAISQSGAWMGIGIGKLESPGRLPIGRRLPTCPTV
jgi:para-nitrobenzyl esterase